MQLGLYGGVERTEGSANPQLDDDFIGFTLFGQLSLLDDVKVFGVANLEWRDYHGSVLTSIGDRQDQAYRFTLGAHYRPVQNWRISPQISYSRNDSNADLSDTRRTSLSINIRYEFN